ncbi:MAG: DNA polymerase I, partial [Alphaproteobacteria bacterium]
PVVIVSSDKDLMQLVSDQVRMYDPMKEKWVGIEEVKGRFGVAPPQVVEVMALAGDSSDNIPGVPGIGEKTARKLMLQYGSLENIFANADKIKGKLGERIREHVEQAKLSLKLVKIKTDVPLEQNVHDLLPREPDRDALRELYTELGFTSLLNTLSPRVEIDRSRYETVLRDRQLLDLIDKLHASRGFAFDTETTSVHPTSAELVGLSFCFEDDRAYYVPVGHSYLDAPKQISSARACAMLKPVLEDPKIPKWAQNAKFDMLVLERCGIKVKGLAGDTMVADYLLAPGRNSHSLDTLAATYLGHTMIKFDELVDGKNVQTFAGVAVDEAAEYAAEDAHVTWLVANKIEAELKKDEATWSLYEDLEMPLVEVLTTLEHHGVLIDELFFSKLSDELAKQIDVYIKEIHEAAGEPFNLNSTQQIAHILFEKLGIKPTKKTKTGYSTDAGVLEKLAEEGHQVPQMLLAYRTLAKIKNTYVDALPKLVNPHTGRIHTSFNQTVTATGRLSSSDPNLQNIPIRSPEGRKIRRGFIPAKGKQLVSADYSQIELRMAAHLSSDPKMIAAFHSGEDFHTRTAAEIMGVFPNMVTSELRSMAKTVNFGVLYGMSAFRLGRDLGIGTKKAQQFIDNYFARFQILKAWLDGVLEDARESGYVSTILGRRRLLPEINSPDRQTSAAAERAAINTPVQGSAADLIKLAMLNLHRRIEKDRLPMSMILQVHDELVFEVDRKAVTECMTIIKKEMEKVMELQVPLVVDIKSGENWMEAH